jgi:mono/diheme cytochrome c family protein
MSIKHSMGFPGVCLSLSVLVSAPALAENYQRGHLLYSNHCQACHAKTIHLGKKRKVKTLSELRERVAGLAAHAGDDWGKAEIDDVVYYLNRRYYHLAR